MTTHRLFPALLFGAALLQATGPIGIFEDHADVGTVKHTGTVEYERSGRTYTVTGSGENMWFEKDEFHFVWKRVDGDFTLTATLEFPREGGNAHRKGALMVRQSLDSDAAYVDVARHGDGLTSLQARPAQGGNTREIQLSRSAPTRVQLIRRGDRVYAALSDDPNEEPWFGGGSMQVAFEGPVYVGLAVCAHDSDARETVVFSAVDLKTGSGNGTSRLFSTIEAVPVGSTDARVVRVLPGIAESPHWNPEGTNLRYRYLGAEEAITTPGITAVPAEPAAFVYTAVHGQIQRSPAEGGPAQPLTSGDMRHDFPHPSPDGKSLVYLVWKGDGPALVEGTEVSLEMMTLAGSTRKTIAVFTGGPHSLDAPCWSPDSRQVTFVSYQRVTAAAPKLH